MWHFLSNKLDLILVTEFPKSGASWFCQMLADASNIPFPRNISPTFERSIMHGHHLFNPRMGKAICVIRDGRDVMVSAYFHFLFDNSHNNPGGVTYHRKKMPFKDYNNVRENLPKFIEYMFKGYPNENRFHFSWSDLINNVKVNQSRLCIVKYEDLLTKPSKCIKNALEFYEILVPDENRLKEIVDNYSFKKLAKRNPGEEDRKSFIRKGISGDWKNYFNEESCDIFKEYAGEELIKAGYENDFDWKNY
ncbi:sulfotransferase domain-containing protein [Sinomicrobium kalidii]|uniref:sulfotransferase domain-containing protein n=1 Tax=Sinomicrobium kalidii TaxID=2900738 RepID=UPI001E57CAA7|nr:sulfotransferase domain-containing protein [Sinomicrobium kalidii]UGU14376.1 sulfotransferase domain-containing protein [Sinomicrobium kalidii]